MKTVVLVTGASSGLGKVIYESLTEMKGYRVYGTSRNPKNSLLLKMDITSTSSVESCVTELLDMEGHIDVVINNAGINIIGSLEGTSDSEFLEQIEVNCIGALRVIKAVMPYFRKLGRGRIINISSIGAKVPLPFNSGYAASKAALENMTESFFYELNGTSIFVSLLEPVGLDVSKIKPNLKYVAMEVPHQGKSRRLFKRMMTNVKPSVSRKRVAEKLVKIIEAPKPKLRYRVGFGSTAILLMKALLPRRIFRYLLMKQMGQ